MHRLVSAAAFATIVSAGLWAAPSMAQDFSGGNPGNPEEYSRDFPTGDQYELREATAVPGITAERSTRALDLDDESVIKAFTAVGRTADGRSVTIAPSENLKKAVKGELAPSDREIDIQSADPLFRAGVEPFDTESAA